MSARSAEVTAYVYDAGALVAAEHRDERMLGLHRRVLARGVEPIVPATVLAQVRRRSHPVLDRVLAGCRIVALDEPSALEVGELMTVAKRNDLVDAHVVTCCISYVATCVTSDGSDIQHLSESARMDGRRRFGRMKVPIIAV